MLSRNEKGAVAELEIATAALKLDVSVYKPVSEHSRADLLFEIGSELWRVQCKWGRLSPSGDTVIVRIGTSRCSPHGYIRTTYTEQEVDMFGIYCGQLDRCFLVPLAVVAGQHEVRLRLTPARNRQQACITLADDHDFDGAVAQLARARGWQPRGQGFESPQLHSSNSSSPESTPIVLGSNPFRDRLGYWMDRVAAGEEVILTRHGKPRIRLSPAA
jgi:PD-(D/E)XK endonuclease